MVSEFLPTGRFKWIDHKQFDLNNYTIESLKGCILEVDFNKYPKESHQMHYDYPLYPDKIETKEKMLSSYQLKIADLYNIPIDNIEKLGPTFFNKEKYLHHYENLQLYLRLELKPKKYTLC